ncbi:MAG: hypothetical protein ACRD1R_01645 [Acidobacteriota bacterium]
MKDKETYSIELERSMYEFMEEMAQQYGLPDVSKAMRCLINYAREENTEHENIFAEIRCVDC